MDDFLDGIGDLVWTGLNSVASDSGTLLNYFVGATPTSQGTTAAAASPGTTATPATTGMSGTTIAIIAGAGLLGLGVLGLIAVEVLK